MDGLSLRLKDGRSILYQDAQGITRFMDPSVSLPGRSAGLIDREAFLELLQRDGLVAIWTVAGEKNAYGDTNSDGFGGRFTFTRLFYSDGNELCALDRLGEYHEPSAQQLAAFLGTATQEQRATDRVNNITELSDKFDDPDF